MNLSNLLSSTESNPVIPKQVQSASVSSHFSLPDHASIHPMNQPQFPNLPGVPGIAQQQILSAMPPVLHQMKSSSQSSGITVSGMSRQAKLEGPSAKKPKL